MESIVLPENVNTKRNLFEENKIFCDICNLWICGIPDIDNHFIVHSFKTWPAASIKSANLNDVLKQKTENLAEYESRLSDVSKINVFDPKTGRRQRLLDTLFDPKRFSEKIIIYFGECEDALDGNDDDDDSASTATTINRDHLLSNFRKEDETGVKNIVTAKREANRVENDNASDKQRLRKKIKIEAERPCNADNSSKDVEDNKRPQKSGEYRSILLVEVISQHPNSNDFVTVQKSSQCDHSEHEKNLSVTQFQGNQHYNSEKEIKTIDGEVPDVNLHITTGEITKTVTKRSVTVSPLKLSLVEAKYTSSSNEWMSAKSPLSTNRKNKGNHQQQPTDVSSKKVKLQKGESPRKETKERKSAESSKRRINTPSWAIDRYTVIQPFRDCDLKKRIITTDSDSSTQSARKSQNCESKTKLNNSKNKRPLEKPLSRRLQLKKSLAIIQERINRLAEKNSRTPPKQKLEKKATQTNKLEEYIQVKSKSDLPLTTEQIQQLRLIREEIISLPFMQKPSMEVEDAMASTYDLRCTELRINTMTIKNSLKIFHGLQNYSLLKSEFKRCTGRSLRVLPHKLNKFFEEMIHKERLYSKLSDRYLVCRQAMEKLNKSQLDMKMQQNVGMILFGYKVTKGNWQGLLFKVRKKEDEVVLEKPTPFIDVVKGDLWTPYKKMVLYVERTKIGCVQSFYDAIIMAYIVYWVFNLEYDDYLRPIFEYFDWIIGNPQNTYK